MVLIVRYFCYFTFDCLLFVGKKNPHYCHASYLYKRYTGSIVSDFYLQLLHFILLLHYNVVFYWVQQILSVFYIESSVPIASITMLDSNLERPSNKVFGNPSTKYYFLKKYDKQKIAKTNRLIKEKTISMMK